MLLLYGVRHGHEELGVMELSPHFWHFYSYIGDPGP